MSGRWETWARLDLGDHGMGVQRDDPARVGLVEVSDVLRWVPREGEGWSVPIGELAITTTVGMVRGAADGVEMRHRDLSTFRVRAARPRRLVRELRARGAAYRPVA